LYQTFVFYFDVINDDDDDDNDDDDVVRVKLSNYIVIISPLTLLGRAWLQLQFQSIKQSIDQNSYSGLSGNRHCKDH